MKRSIVVLLALTALLAFACKPQDTSNGNGNGNGNTANNNKTVSNANNNNSGGEGIAAGTEKSVTITIADDPASPGKCIISLAPDPVRLSKANKDKIKWCIVNNSTSASGATVTIGGFTDQANPGKKNPFGDGSEAENTFDITSANYNCSIKTKDATSGEVGVTYKYNITVKVSGTEKCKLDPQVIIDN
jgi:hypothetical protein